MLKYTLLLLILLTGGIGRIGVVLAAPPNKPLVVVFAAEPTGGIAAADDLDGQTATERNLQVARAVRDRLEENEAVSGVLFSPEAPLFLRAAQEAGVKLGETQALTGSERVALAKAAGAIYLVVIATQLANREELHWELRLEGTDIRSGKTYSDKAPYQGIVRAPATNSDAIAPVRTSGAGSSPLINAANTLVVRLLAGPLSDFGRSAPPANLLPPAVKPVAPPPARNEEDVVRAAEQQGKLLLEQGDSATAIVLLRKSINQAPLHSSLRTLLAQAYLAAHQGGEAASEIRRAMLLIPPATTAQRTEMTALLGQALAQSGDTTAARSTYEQIISTSPDSPEVNWARLALAEVLLARDRPDEAIAQYRAALKSDRGNQDAAVGLAKVLAGRGEYIAALGEIAPQSPDGKPASKSARHAASVVLFDVAAPELARLMKANRLAWEEKQLTREVFYNATRSQAVRASALINMVKSAPPDAAANSPEARKHTRRILAASLLSQAATALQEFLESGDQDAGSQAALCLLEFAREFETLQERR